jgi:hypothetical protein
MPDLSWLRQPPVILLLCFLGLGLAVALARLALQFVRGLRHRRLTQRFASRHGWQWAPDDSLSCAQRAETITRIRPDGVLGSKQLFSYRYVARNVVTGSLDGVQFDLCDLQVRMRYRQWWRPGWRSLGVSACLVSAPRMLVPGYVRLLVVPPEETLDPALAAVVNIAGPQGTYWRGRPGSLQDAVLSTAGPLLHSLRLAAFTDLLDTEGGAVFPEFTRRCGVLAQDPRWAAPLLARPVQRLILAQEGWRCYIAARNDLLLVMALPHAHWLDKGSEGEVFRAYLRTEGDLLALVQLTVGLARALVEQES